MFAEQEGKRGGEFFTPSCVVRTLVEILKPFKGRVYEIKTMRLIKSTKQNMAFKVASNKAFRKNGNPESFIFLPWGGRKWKKLLYIN
jgi:type I restriction-modification system DNA methylase subunit